MIFEIDRASNWGYSVDEPPCDKAYKTEITHTDGGGMKQKLLKNMW